MTTPEHQNRLCLVEVRADTPIAVVDPPAELSDDDAFAARFASGIFDARKVGAGYAWTFDMSGGANRETFVMCSSYYKTVYVVRGKISRMGLVIVFTTGRPYII